MSTFDFSTSWDQGDLISHLISLALLVMSVLSWSVIVIKAARLLNLRELARHAQEDFWCAKSWEDALLALGSRRNNPFCALALRGKAATLHQASRTELRGTLDPSAWLARSLKDVLDESADRAQAGMAILASVGSTAPFVGLFGTVWGIYHALHVIGSTGQSSLAQVAGPVGESLIMTAFGLCVAIPAVLGYNAIARRHKAYMHKLGRFASDLHAYFLTGARIERPGEETGAAAVRSAGLVTPIPTPPARA